ncbi:3445_t:CDS:2, partial [Funneliformis geosporum]
MSYILIRAINHRHYKAEIINKIKNNNYSLGNRTQVSNIIVNCWVKMAKACKAVFKSSYIITDIYNDYASLKKTLEQVTEILLKVFGETFSSLPNLYILRHLLEVAVNFRTLVNTSVSLKEAVHGLYKRVISHINKKDISMNLSKRDNTLQTIRYILDDGLDTRYNEVNNLFTNIACDAKLCKLLNGWYIETPLLQADTEDVNANNSVQKQGLLTTISVENLLAEITRIYKDVYNTCIGEAIDVEDVDNPGESAYALIRAIIIHKDDNRHINPFLLVDWFYKNGNIDSATGFSVYRLQDNNDTLWFHLHSLIIVDRQPKVHFVYKCTNLCLEDSHDNN